MDYSSATTHIRLLVEPNPRLKTYCPSLYKELEEFLKDIARLPYKEVTDASSQSKEE